MSDSAGRPSPTGLLSPTDDLNGFTAVNPPGGPKSARMAEGVRNSQDEARSHGFEPEIHRNGNGSPLNSAAKRKRVSVGSTEEESDESAGNDGTPETGIDPRNYPGPPPIPPTGDVRERAWQNGHGHSHGHGHSRPMEAEESRLAEALQRENHGGPGHNGMMEDDRGGMGRPTYYQNEHNGIITTNAGVQMDPKKRKRVSIG